MADQILQNKQEMVELDKRRQSNREAKCSLEKSTDKKAWVTVGPILVKMTKERGEKLLEKGMRHLVKCEVSAPKLWIVSIADQQTIDIEINKLRSEQKILVGKLRDLEYQSPLKGFDLKPLDRKEAAALSASTSFHV